MRILLAAASLAFATVAIAQGAPVGSPMLWSYVSSSHSFYQLEREDARQTLQAGRITVWVVADHSRDRTVRYRRTRQQMAFDCNGAFRITAFTSYMPDGRVHDDWQRAGTMKRIEPNTLAASLEPVLCD